MSDSVFVLSVSGLPGSGTSTACQRLRRELGWFYANAGQVFRELAAEAGLSLAAFGARAVDQAGLGLPVGPSLLFLGAVTLLGGMAQMLAGDGQDPPPAR